MAKTVAIIVIIILSLGCGALGYEALRHQKDKDALTEKVESLENDLLVVKARAKPRPAAAKAAPAVPGSTTASLTALQTQLDLLIDANKKLKAKLEEHESKLSQLEKLKASGGSGGDTPEDQTEAQKEALQEAVKKELQAQDKKRAEAIKSVFIQRFNAELQKNAEKLDLAPMQKDDITNLVKRQIDKGFKMVMEAFDKGDLEAVREPIRQLIEETYGEIDRILDADQIEKLKELDKDGFGRWKEQQQGR
jgi:hypothetical protein